MKNQIYVVEGKNDVTRLKQVFPNINVVSVNGSAINDDIVDLLINKKDTHEIILCMDPDYPGEKIRKKLSDTLGVVSHIFIERKIAYSFNKSKIGLEHLSNGQIKEAFKNIIKESDATESDLTLSFLVDHKIVGDTFSKTIRNDLAKKLNLGYVNGKTFLARAISFNITKEDILKIIYNE